MINCFEINDALQLVPLAPDRVPEACQAADAWVWVDLRGEDSGRVEEWLDALRVGGLPRQLLLDARDRPGFYPLKEALFLVIPMVPGTSGATDTDHLAVFCRENLLLTVHERSYMDPRDLDSIGDAGSWLPERSVAGLLAAVMVDLSLDDLSRARGLRSSVDTLEARMDREPETLDADEILAGRNELLLLGSVVSDQLPVLQALGAIDKPYFRLRDAQEYMACALANLQSVDGSLTWLDQRVTALRAGLQMHAQEKTNRRLGMLTILSAIFMPITLLAGIWGMNFESMPELKYSFSYPLALGVMVMIGTGMYFFFRRTGWFD
jgi:magnesium transporter